MSLKLHRLADLVGLFLLMVLLGGCEALPVHEALNRGQADEALRLVSKGTGVQDRDASGNTALHLAARKGYVAVAQALLDHGADLNAKNVLAWTPLMEASREGHRDVVELLLARHAEVNARSTRGATALYLAAFDQQPEIVRALVDAGADAALCDNEGTSTLLAMCSHAGDPQQQAELACYLISKGVSPKLASKNGWTALHGAAELNAVAVGAVLVDAGASIASAGPGGRTPLHCAGDKEAAGMVAFLLDHGAQPSILTDLPDVSAKTYRAAARYCEQKGQAEVAREDYRVAAEQFDLASIKAQRMSEAYKQEVNDRNGRNMARGLVWLITPVNVPAPVGEETNSVEAAERTQADLAVTYKQAAGECRQKAGGPANAGA